MAETEIERLVSGYGDSIKQPWPSNLSGQEKVWIVVYDPRQERRLRLRLANFRLATINAGHGWIHVDLTNAFTTWMSAHEYREDYFGRPEDLEMDLKHFGDHVTQLVVDKLTATDADDNTVVAVTGLASLFGLARSSSVLEHAAPSIRGRLVAFFPGKKEGSNYRLLDAQDGGNYLAVTITAHD